MEVLLWFFMFGLWVVGIIGVCEYACRLGRSMGLWILSAIFFSPVITAVLLYMFGETDEHRQMRIMEEERWRLDVINGKVPEPVVPEPEENPFLKK